MPVFFYAYAMHKQCLSIAQAMHNVAQAMHNVAQAMHNVAQAMQINK